MLKIPFGRSYSLFSFVSLLFIIQFSSVCKCIIYNFITVFLSTFFSQFVFFFRICLSTFPVNHTDLWLSRVVDFLGANFSMASCIISLNKFHIRLDDSNFKLISDIRSGTNSCTALLFRQDSVIPVGFCDYKFSALMLLVGQQEGHPACKNWVVGCCGGYLSGARCRLAYGPADATATHCLLLQ